MIVTDSYWHQGFRWLRGGRPTSLTSRRKPDPPDQNFPRISSAYCKCFKKKRFLHKMTVFFLSISIFRPHTRHLDSPPHVSGCGRSGYPNFSWLRRKPWPSMETTQRIAILLDWRQLRSVQKEIDALFHRRHIKRSMLREQTESLACSSTTVGPEPQTLSTTRSSTQIINYTNKK